MSNGNWVEVGEARKSTHSNGQAECVEVGFAEPTTVIAVRDTQDRDGVTLTFPVAAWAAFTKSIDDSDDGN